jgi:hypothetical protein
VLDVMCVVVGGKVGGGTLCGLDGYFLLVC